MPADVDHSDVGGPDREGGGARARGAGGAGVDICFVCLATVLKEYFSFLFIFLSLCLVVSCPSSLSLFMLVASSYVCDRSRRRALEWYTLSALYVWACSFLLHLLYFSAAISILLGSLDFPRPRCLGYSRC